MAKWSNTMITVATDKTPELVWVLHDEAEALLAAYLERVKQLEPPARASARARLQVGKIEIIATCGKCRSVTRDAVLGDYHCPTCAKGGRPKI